MKPKFKIGQFVFIRQTVKVYQMYVKPLLEKSKDKGYVSMGEMDLQRPSPFQIIEIHTQQCYGGIQIHYHMRGNSQTIAVYTEPELCESIDEEL